MRVGMFLGGILLAFAVAFYLWTIQIRSHHGYSTDFAQFHASAENLSAGKDVYTPLPWERYGPLPENFDIERPHKHPNLNPPFQSILFLPFATLSFEDAFRVWSILSITFGACAAAIVARQLDTPAPHGRVVIALVLLSFLYFPSWLNVFLGQLGHLLFLLGAIAWTSARSGRDALAGVALGVSLAIKPFTGLFIILFLLSRRWRLLFWYIFTFAVCVTLSLAFVGLDAHLRYVALLSEVTWFAATWNASILGFASRIFGGAGNQPLIDAPEARTAVLLIAAVLAVAVLARLARRRRALPGSDDFDIAFATVIPLMLLLSPLGWLYYFPYLTISFVILFRVSKTTARRWTYLTSAAVAWLLGTLPHFQTRSEKVSDPALIFTYPAFYCLALVILVLTLIALAAARDRQRTLEPGPDKPP